MEKGQNGVRARRGGSWNNPDTNLRCSARNNNNPHNRNNNMGFRVLRGLLPNHARRHCQYCLAKPTPDAGVLRNTGLVFGHDMRLFFQGTAPPILGVKPEYK